MSAEVAVRAALIEALRADSALMSGLNGLFDGRPGRASEPYAVVGDCLGNDWGAKDVDGRELTLAIQLYDVGERPERLGALLALIDLVVRDVGAGAEWRVISARLVRSRVARTGTRDGWQGVADYRLRVVRG
ncbi:DUF3168 domain-containing protein [Sphingobium bisphenolivorans]|uniref:DUF3168 domain-containing protein n=1 Tax=Sphingobium bisphenolivorans TaxID=1335760 RepID=UPI0003A04015|nr:DUF3168 domain-containing protein [Sphingobium bisphenolivorans]